MLWLYRVLAALAGPFIISAATLKGRYGGPWRERLGLCAPWPASGTLRLWLHAASLGETRTALNLLEALRQRRPEVEFVLSVGTPAALKLARSLAQASPDKLRIVAAPVDFWGAPARAVRRLKPQAVIIVETELWPNFIVAARRFSRRLFLAAGRISARSFSRYRKISGFMGRLLGCFDQLAMIGPLEARRATALGAPAGKVLAAGNPKYDQLLSQAAAEPPPARLKTAFQSPLLLAGSTHPGEEALILAAYKNLLLQLPGLKLVVVPRHIRWAEAAALLSRKAGFETGLWAAPADCPAREVTIVAVSGQLFKLYSLASVAFIGGSWNRPEGHNPLEAAAWGKPMIFGPGMAEFRQAADALLTAGAAREAGTAAELAQAALPWLNNPQQARKDGEAGRKYLQNLQPAAPRLAEMILNLSEN